MQSLVDIVLSRESLCHYYSRENNVRSIINYLSFLKLPPPWEDTRREGAAIQLEAARCRPRIGSRTPMAISFSESKNDQIRVDRTNYMLLVGLFNYLAILTRPDLLYSLPRVAQATSNQRIFRYVLYTLLHLCFSNLQLSCQINFRVISLSN